MIKKIYKLKYYKVNQELADMIHNNFNLDKKGEYFDQFNFKSRMEGILFKEKYSKIKLNLDFSLVSIGEENKIG